MGWGGRGRRPEGATRGAAGEPPSPPCGPGPLLPPTLPPLGDPSRLCEQAAGVRMGAAGGGLRREGPAPTWAGRQQGGAGRRCRAGGRERAGTDLAKARGGREGWGRGTLLCVLRASAGEPCGGLQHRGWVSMRVLDGLEVEGGGECGLGVRWGPQAGRVAGCGRAGMR